MKKMMHRTFFALLMMAVIGPVSAQSRRPNLKRVYFNMYTDSIKTILNYYVNVEGEYSNGRILPLDTSVVTIIADHGMMSGNEWIAPKVIDFEKVTFHAVAKEDARINDRATVWLKRLKDPRDEMDAGDVEIPVVPENIRKRRR